MKNLTYTMAFWLLRFWLAARAIGTGLTKFQTKVNAEVPNLEKAKEIKEMMAAGMDKQSAIDSVADMPDTVEKVVDTLSFSAYHGLPEKGPMTVETFSESPLMPAFMVEPYAMVLGFALIGLGVTLALGICTRVTLFLMGLLYISRTWGFIVLEPSMGPSAAAGIAYLGVHMIMIVGALLLADYNKFELVKCGKFGCCPCTKKD